MKLRVASAVLSCCLLFSGLAVAADPMCYKLTGAAFGQCQAAVAVGCDGTANQPEGCTTIAKTFIRIVGEQPPWELGQCLCGTLEEYVRVIADSNPTAIAEIRAFKEGYTIVAVGNVLETPVRLDFSQAFFFSFYPGSTYPPETPKQTCGWGNTSWYQLNDVEAKSCVATILKAASDTGIKVIEP